MKEPKYITAMRNNVLTALTKEAKQNACKVLFLELLKKGLLK